MKGLSLCQEVPCGSDGVSPSNEITDREVSMDEA